MSGNYLLDHYWPVKGAAMRPAGDDTEPQGPGNGGWWPNSHQLWQLARDAATLSHVAINLRGRLCQMRRHHSRRSAEVRLERAKTRQRQGATDPLEEPLSMLFGED